MDLNPSENFHAGTTEISVSSACSILSIENIPGCYSELQKTKKIPAKILLVRYFCILYFSWNWIEERGRMKRTQLPTSPNGRSLDQHPSLPVDFSQFL